MSGTSTPLDGCSRAVGHASARTSRAGPSPSSISARTRCVWSSTKSDTRAAATLHNEKSICAIGRDMVTSGRLHDEGCADGAGSAGAFPHARRRAGRDACARRWRRRRRATPPTAPNSCAAPKRAWGAPIRVLSGEDEARIAAEGVVAGIPDADGLVADLGGGSLDMVTVQGGKTGDAVTLAVRSACA